MAMWRPPERIRHDAQPGLWPTEAEARASRLFQPVKIGSLLLDSRTWVPAMAPWRATEDGFVTPDVIDWYRRFAQGRPAAIVVEATGIRDVPSGPLLRIGHDRFLPGLESLAKAVREASDGRTRLFIQLIDFLSIRRRPDPAQFFSRYLNITAAHRERLAMVDAPESEVRAALAGLSAERLCDVLTPAEFEALQFGARERVTDTQLPHIAALPSTLPPLFAAAAERARRAGFDGVELHYAHAYTMASFLSATNMRVDGYGQSIEGRLRLPLEVFAAVRGKVGTDYPVGCRFLADECIEGGSDVNDAAQMAVAFARAGMDFVSLSRGGKFDDALQPKVGEAAYPYTGRSGYECMPSYLSDAQGPFGRNLDAAARIRAAVRGAGNTTPIIAGGGIHDFQQAERVLADGTADLVSIARQALADPDWFRKVRSGHGQAVRLCRYTNYCEALDQRHRQVTCELWDRIDRDAPSIALSNDGKRRRLVAPPWNVPTPVRMSVRQGVAVLEIDYPPVNALARPVRAALLEAIVRADDDESIAAIVIVGAGRAFVAGAEIGELENPPIEPVLVDVLARIESCGKPVAAAISGFALGGGLELALACHLRVAGSNARLGLPEIKLGLMPGAGGTQRLPRLIGAEASIEMMLGGDPVSAARARELGLLDHVVESGDLLESALDHALRQRSSGAPTRRVCDLPSAKPASAEFLEQILKRHAKATRGLVSPPRILQSVAAASSEPFARGTALSRRLFEECRTSVSSQALRHLFFAERAAGKTASTSQAIERVAVIGAGTMGVGIAIALADAGLQPRVVDLDAAALERGRRRFEAHYESQSKRGRCTAQEATDRIARTIFSTEIAAAADCDFAIEAVFESLQIKQQVFAKIDEVMPPHAFLASNTSYLDIERIAAATRRPESVLGMHFFSPANVMKLVEVVCAKATRGEAIATGVELARRLRKIPVCVGNSTGFVGNRMLQAYGRESQLLLLEGATPAQVDAALEEWGMAMGPCAVFDLAGLDVGYRARRERSDLPDDVRYFRVADRLVESGRLGRKSGAGHYVYRDGADRQEDPEALRIIEAESRALGIARRLIDATEIVERCIFALIVEGSALLESGVAASSADIDVVWVNGYGFPRYRGGPMFHARALGSAAVRDILDRLTRNHGAAYWNARPTLR